VRRAKLRARRREAHIKALVAAGKIDRSKAATATLDAERWLPRKQRSYAKRGRKRNKFLGAQVCVHANSQCDNVCCVCCVVRITSV
jgi:SRP72 RNA-binding domain